ncbi:Uncharacterised protein [Escherichia coli]|uniref:Uncharacterized protein n=1 Tax=Escherichia coli TaxID=562 RepID=A0A376MVI3_ECOLX|nr:Uncharacterised protein [Escherichia coli]
MSETFSICWGQERNRTMTFQHESTAITCRVNGEPSMRPEHVLTARR